MLASADYLVHTRRGRGRQPAKRRVNTAEEKVGKESVFTVIGLVQLLLARPTRAVAKNPHDFIEAAVDGDFLEQISVTQGRLDARA